MGGSGPGLLDTIHPGDSASRELLPASGDRGEQAYLLVFHGSSSSLVPLAFEGKYVLGRDPQADVAVNDRAMSRRHAVIEVHAGAATLLDLGSRYGTRINGLATADPVRLASGDVIRVGDTQIVFQWLGPGRAPERRILDLDHFRQRLDGESERSLRYLHPLGLVLLHLGGPPKPALQALIMAGLRVMDSVGQLDPHTLAVLLPELQKEHAAAVAERLVQALLSSVPHVRAGFACWPNDACDVDALMAAARSALEWASPGGAASAQDTVLTYRFGGRTAVFADPAMSRLFSLAKRLAGSGLPVLLHGETGVGKEVFASAIHQFSPRARAPLVVLNCAALPESLAESELFGHARGAFTGADRARPGRLEAAHGGTLFLDEIGELPLSIQAKLLRVLEDHQVTRLGDNEVHAVDLRIVAATNRDLSHEVAAGRFRGDLFFRLSVGTVFIPPLRERPREIPVLARLVLEEAAQRSGREPLVITPESMRLLASHTWKGNVRELRNLLERAQALAVGPTLEPEMLPELTGEPEARPPEAGAEQGARFRLLGDEVRELEARRIREALDAFDGVQLHAAAALGIPMRTFQVKVKQYGIEAGRRSRRRE